MHNNNYILTPDGNFVSEDELYRYGVLGMKWGVRKAEKYERKANTARTSAKEWDEIARYQKARLRLKGDSAKASKAESKYKSYAKKDRVDARKYDEKAKSYRKEVSKTKSAIKEYRSKFDAAEKASNTADELWAAAFKQYESLGKTRVSRILNAARDKSDASKKYHKMYDSASRAGDFADTKWNQVSELYKKTGRNRVERILNNIQYNRM